MRRHLPGSFWVPFCGKKVQNTRDIVAAFSVLLMSTDARSTSRDRLRAMPCQKEENERSEVKSTKTIRMSLSREQPPARVERAQQEQDYAASRSGHAGCRLFLFRCKRECGLFSPRFAANDSPVEDCDQYFLRPNSIWKSPRQGRCPGVRFRKISRYFPLWNQICDFWFGGPGKNRYL